MAPHLCVMGGGDQEMLRAVELRAVNLTFCGWQVTAAATNEAIISRCTCQFVHGYIP